MVPSSKSLLIAIGVVLCALLATGIILFSDLAGSRAGEDKNDFQFSEPVTEDYTEIDATVVSVDERNRTVRVTLSTGEGREVKIWPETQIVRVVTHDGDALTSTQEYNIADIPAGAQVQIRYGADANGVLTYVDQIYLGEITYEEMQNGSKPAQLFAVTISAFNPDTRTLDYKGRSLVINADYEQSIVIPNEISIYTVDPIRSGVLHARIPSDISALQAGKNVYLIFAAAAEGEVAALESVIVAE